MIHLIGVVKSDLKENKTIGYRVLDTRCNKYRDIVKGDCYNTVAGSSFPTIVGLKVGDKPGELKGSNGDLSRYPKVSINKGVIENSIIVIAETADGGYILADGNGLLGKYNNEQAVQLALVYGVANGKLSGASNNKKIIPIKYKYAKVQK